MPNKPIKVFFAFVGALWLIAAIVVGLRMRSGDFPTPSEIAAQIADLREMHALEVRNYPRNHADDAASAACQEKMLQLLKSPGSARFGDVKIYNDGGGSYHISNWVDSQNGFGAMLRTRYTCRVETDDGVAFTANVQILP